MAFTIGLDYGTNSVRALIVSVKDGKELGTGVIYYPSGQAGVLLDPHQPDLARQHPGDYLIGLEQSVLLAMAEAKHDPSFDPKQVIGVGVDTTGSSPIPVDQKNVPLGTQSKWRNNLAAQCWLWKDHTSHAEAATITKIAREHRPQYVAKCGNTYSSEWFWSKIWRCLKVAPEVFDAAYSWVELADWIPSVLAGISDPKQVMRGICAAGHKALYSDEWNGLPDQKFLAMLDPKLADLRGRLFEKAHDATVRAGTLSAEWATKLGIPAGIPIAIGELDVHYGAIGSGIEEGMLVKAIGTSTCDCIVVPMDKHVPDIPGICGIVPGAILPNFYGIEAGQSAVGDIFNWWVSTICQGDVSMHMHFTGEAERLKPGQSGLLALDWNNGNRTVLVDPRLSGLMIGQTLQTTPAQVYRALIEATAFGARAIIERISEYQVVIDRVVCCGGIAEKNPLLNQIYADVTGCTLQMSGSAQACALGSAVAAAVVAGPAAGGHRDFKTAQAAMTSVKPKHYRPIAENQKIYDRLYALYLQLHDAFGGVNRASDLSNVMKELIEIREQVSATVRD